MRKTHLFIDGSFNSETRLGAGAFLTLTTDEMLNSIKVRDPQLKFFGKTTSNKVELQTLLWALKMINSQSDQVIIYTDSSTIVNLLSRKGHLLCHQFKSKKGVLLSNHKEYEQFFNLINPSLHSFVKMSGHLPFKKKERLDQIFSKADKAARRFLRNVHKSQNNL